MKIGPLFIGFCDYGMAFGIIVNIPKCLFRYRLKKFMALLR